MVGHADPAAAQGEVTMPASLTMTVERLGNDASVPIERRGCMTARIVLCDADRGQSIDLLGTRDGFEPAAVAAMLRTFGDVISRKWGV